MYQICIVIFILIIVFFWSRDRIDGFWVISSQFCEDAEIDNFVLLIKEVDLFGDAAAYVLLSRDNEILVNEPCSVRIRRNFFSRKYKITFKDLEVDGFPLVQTMEIQGDRMRLFDGETLYGEFFKDTENTYLLKK